MPLIPTIARTIIVTPAASLAAGADDPPAWAGSPEDWPTRLGRWGSDLPAGLLWLVHVAGTWWWPGAPLFLLAVLLGTVTMRVALAVAWRRIAAGGVWVQVTPPRLVDAGDWAMVWRRLRRLAVRARGGWWRLARPPLAFEVHGEGGRLTAGLWLPGWVPYRQVADEVARAWPGASVQPGHPPLLCGRVAGYRLAASAWRPETGWLIDEPRAGHAASRSGVDPVLGRLLAALGEPGGPAVLQVLVRPATRGRLGRLRTATMRPITAPPIGVGLVMDLVVLLLSVPVRVLMAGFDFATGTGRGAGRVTPDPVQAEAMRDARAKLGDPPHLLVAVRVAAVRGMRWEARETAQAVAAGFGEASAWLRPVRLGRPAAVLPVRRAGGREWLLMTATELGVLAHLPPDPARYGFDTAALHRPHPAGVRQAAPEPATRTGAGWTRMGWTAAPTVTNDSDPDPNSDDDNESPEVI
jgi:hypothetical protein